MDKPELIRVAGKGTIRIVYSADGEKLQRAFIPEAGGLSTITSYINGFVYQQTTTITTATAPPLTGGAASLSYINFEEGRIRVVKNTSISNGYDVLTIGSNMTLPGSPSGDGGVYDYFIMDYQQNVRMILTEEIHVASNTATMEISRAANEEPVFGQTGANNEVATTRYNTPVGWSGNSTSSVSRLGNLSGHNIGPNALQKVMAGDHVTATVQYYHQANSNGGGNLLAALLNSLGQAIMGSSGTSNIVKGNATNITNTLNANIGFVNTVQPGNGKDNPPLAYLTVLFFDERFNFITAADGGVYQSQVAATVGSSGSSLGFLGVRAPKNGYMYAYVSNSSDQDVYFDNFGVFIAAGNIIEENHYYAYGLKISGISSKKLADANEGEVKNNYFYNDKELFDDADLNWYDYGFRNYDPQIGRFMQLDPLTFDYPFYTPYQFAGCEPIANVDMDGLEPKEVVKAIETFSAQGLTSISAHVSTTAATFGKWIVGGWKNGIAISKTISTTGQLWNRLAFALKGLGLASHTLSVGRVLHQSQLGDMRSYFKIPDESQLALNEAKQAIDLISHDWHGIDPNTAVTLKISFPQSGSINWSTGQVRPGKTAIEMVDGPETWIPMLLGGIELKLGARLGAEILEEGAAKAGANLLKPLAMGSTGRTVARNLTEQLAMKEIMSNPAMGRVIKTGLKDARWKGWSKMAWNNGGVEIHYVAKFENGVLKAVDDFKFIGGQ